MRHRPPQRFFVFLTLVFAAGCHHAAPPDVPVPPAESAAPPTVTVGEAAKLPPKPPPTSESGTRKVGELGEKIAAFAERAESVGFTGTVLAAKGGKVVAAVGVGSADLGGKTANTPDTLFEIASATKPLTATAVVRLAQDGKLNLDDPISKHLPGVPENCQKITVRHLLQHTSGIPGTNSFGAGEDFAAVLPLFLRGGPKNTPGTKFEYWNQGYSLLSEVIARTSGKPYTAYLKEALFARAGMAATLFTGDTAPAGTAVAMGRSTFGPPRSALEHPYGSYGFQYRGMGGAVTSVWDLWRWDRALAGTALLSAGSKAEMFKPEPSGYALGWFVKQDARGRSVQSHGGSVRGFVCEFRRYPGQNACVIVLCNKDDAPARQMADAVEAVLFGDPSTVKDIPRPLSAADATAIVGRFTDAKGAVLTVELDGKIVRARIDWYEKGPVTRTILGVDAAGKVVMYEWTEATKIDIDRDGAGPAKSISILDRKFTRAPGG